MTVNPCIISVAITGSLPKKADNPAVPISVAEQVESTQAAFEAGATLVHLHVRNDDGTPKPAPERFAAVLDGIRKHAPGMITQVSTGKWPLGRRARARRHALAASRHGLARHRFGQFPDPGLRQRARPGRLARERDEGLRHQARGRGLRPGR